MYTHISPPVAPATLWLWYALSEQETMQSRLTYLGQSYRIEERLSPKQS